MAISIQNRESKGIAVVAVSGRLTLGQETNDLRAAVKKLLSGGRDRIVLNLGKVEYIDSSGLGTLVGLNTAALGQGAKIKLAQVTGRLQELMVLTKLLTVFDIHDSEEAAVASFASQTATA